MVQHDDEEIEIVEPETAESVAGRSDPAGARPDRLATLARISRALARPLDLVGVFRAVYAELSEVIDATIFILGLYDEPTQMIHVVRQIYDGVETPGVTVP